MSSVSISRLLTVPRYRNLGHGAEEIVQVVQFVNAVQKRPAAHTQVGAVAFAVIAFRMPVRQIISGKSTKGVYRSQNTVVQHLFDHPDRRVETHVEAVEQFAAMLFDDAFEFKCLIQPSSDGFFHHDRQAVFDGINRLFEMQVGRGSDDDPVHAAFRARFDRRAGIHVEFLFQEIPAVIQAFAGQDFMPQ